MFDIAWPVGEYRCSDCDAFVELPTPPDMDDGDMVDIVCPACGDEVSGLFLGFVDHVEEES